MYNMATRTTTVTRVNGTSAAHTALSLQNRAVTHGVFTALLPEGGVAAEGLIEHPAVRGLSEEERRTVELAAERMTQVISSSPNITVEKTVRELKDSRWAVNGDNLHDEFREVERRTFSDGVHWGRVIAFLAFSVSFAAYVSSRGIKGGVGSVFAWTNQTLNETLVDFLQREGWKGFIKYSKTLQEAQERQQRRPNGAQVGVWESVAATVGAVGVGAVLAFGLRQAFS